MFGDKLAVATAKIKALAGLLLAAGFTKINADTLADNGVEASSLPTAADFTAHLAAREQAAVAKATEPLNQKITAFETQLATAGAAAVELAALRQGLTDAGVTVGAFVSAKDAEGADDAAKAKNAAAKNAATVKAAIEAAVAGKATKQIAASGHPHAIETPPGAGDEKSAGLIGGFGAPATAEELLQNKRAIAKTNPAAAQEYFRKHKAKFGY